MKRWLSLIKRHITPGTWAKPAKTRRPITVMVETEVARKASPPADYYVTAPLVPLRAPQPLPPPLCDVDSIMSRYAAWRADSPAVSVRGRNDSQTLPIGDIAIPPQAFVDYSFIHFEPTYTVTVSELSPHQLMLRKPRAERRSRRFVSFLNGVL